MPAGRHEAACASGSIAALATAEIQAQRYDCVLVAGVELERNVPGSVAARHLGAATWVGQEAQDVRYTIGCRNAPECLRQAFNLDMLIWFNKRYILRAEGHDHHPFVQYLEYVSLCNNAWGTPCWVRAI